MNHNHYSSFTIIHLSFLYYFPMIVNSIFSPIIIHHHYPMIIPIIIYLSYCRKITIFTINDYHLPIIPIIIILFITITLWLFSFMMIDLLAPFARPTPRAWRAVAMRRRWPWPCGWPWTAARPCEILGAVGFWGSRESPRMLMEGIIGKTTSFRHVIGVMYL